MKFATEGPQDFTAFTGVEKGCNFYRTPKGTFSKLFLENLTQVFVNHFMTDDIQNIWE